MEDALEVKYAKSRLYYCIQILGDDFVYIYSTKGSRELFLEARNEANKYPSVVVLTPGDAREFAKEILDIADFAEDADGIREE